MCIQIVYINNGKSIVHVTRGRALVVFWLFIVFIEDFWAQIDSRAKVEYTMKRVRPEGAYLTSP